MAWSGTVADEGVLSDGGLLSRIAQGDRSAFELIYRRYSRSMLGLARRRLGDHGRAEDAVQETFTSIWRTAASYRPERGAAAPWQYTIARNAISDRGRKRPEAPMHAPDQRSLDAGPSRRAEENWVSGRVHSAAEDLPSRERELIELAYWRGLSHSEIAVRLGIPLGTVKTGTRSALSRLADTLQDDIR